jgi:hypothetical protein
VKIKLRSLLVIAMALAMTFVSQGRGAQAEDESLVEKLKRFFVKPTPTPHATHKK